MNKAGSRNDNARVPEHKARVHDGDAHVDENEANIGDKYPEVDQDNTNVYARNRLVNHDGTAVHTSEGSVERDTPDVDASKAGIQRHEPEIEQDCTLAKTHDTYFLHRKSRMVRYEAFSCCWGFGHRRQGRVAEPGERLQELEHAPPPDKCFPLEPADAR